MSKGTPRATFRIPDVVAVEVETTIARRNVHTDAPPWSFTGFILAAIREKLDKMNRSRRPRRKLKLQTTEEWERNARELAVALLGDEDKDCLRFRCPKCNGLVVVGDQFCPHCNVDMPVMPAVFWMENDKDTVDLNDTCDDLVDLDGPHQLLRGAIGEPPVK